MRGQVSLKRHLSYSELKIRRLTKTLRFGYAIATTERALPLRRHREPKLVKLGTKRATNNVRCSGAARMT